LTVPARLRFAAADFFFAVFFAITTPLGRQCPDLNIGRRVAGAITEA
jgi:hypothetical protein